MKNCRSNPKHKRKRGIANYPSPKEKGFPSRIKERNLIMKWKRKKQMPGYRPAFFRIVCLAGVCGLVLVLLFVKANQGERRGEHQEGGQEENQEGSREENHWDWADTQPFSWDTWNTKESIDTSRERLERYERLKQRYFPENSPHGCYIWAEEAPALPLQSMLGSDICAVVTVTKGREQQSIENREATDKFYSAYRELVGKPGEEPLNPEQLTELLQKKPSLMWEILLHEWEEKFEVKVDEYLYDRTGRYADTLTIQKKLDSAWWHYGAIPGYKGLRMVVFLRVENSGNGISDLRWNYFISDDGYVVPMTENYADYRLNDDEYVGMWDYGGYRLEDYLEVVRTGYNGLESEKSHNQAIYEYLNRRLTPSVIQTINGSEITSAWEIVAEETEGEIRRYQMVALTEDFWIDEVLQQAIGIGTLEVGREKDGIGYTVKADDMEWREVDLEKGELIGSFSEEALARLEEALEEAEIASEWWIREQRERLDREARSASEGQKQKRRTEKRYEKIRALSAE